MSDAATQGQEQAQPTTATALRTKLDAFMDSLKGRSTQFETLLADSGVSKEKFLEVGRRAMSMNPDLLNCTAASLMQALINCATDGLLPDGRNAAIVIYKNVAQYQPMYQGLLKIAYRSGNFTSIEARVVYAGDVFEYRLGDDPFIHHLPKVRPAGATPGIVNAYAVAKTVNGGIFREVFEEADIRKVNAVSRAAKGPGKDWPEEMARKGPLRRLWKFLPKDEAMERIAERDDETYLEGVNLTEPEPRKLTTGFAPKRADPGVEYLVQEGARAAAPAEELGDDGPPASTAEGDGEAGRQPPPQDPDDDFPGDRPMTFTTRDAGPAEQAPADGGPTFDAEAWGRGMIEQFGRMNTVKAVNEAWIEAKTKGWRGALQRVNPDLFDSVVAAKESREDELFNLRPGR